MTAPLTLACLAFAALSALLWRRQRRLRREAHIRRFVLPVGLFDKLMRKHPQLSIRDCQLVAQGLRQFFLAHLKSGRQYVSMPSQVADDLWHEFILYTKNYQQFCLQGFGRFLHHTPAAVLGKGQQGNAGLLRCWHYACLEENINPARAARLPLLFALDAKFNIVDGFIYAPDCSGLRRQGEAPVYCGADLGNAGDSGCAGGDSGGHQHGHGDGHGGSDGGAGGDGGSDGGGGCGGGGCGGD